MAAVLGIKQYLSAANNSVAQIRRRTAASTRHRLLSILCLHRVVMKECVRVVLELAIGALLSLAIVTVLGHARHITPLAPSATQATAERASESVVQQPQRRYNPSDIVCAVITTKKYHATRARAVKETWGTRCGVTVYISADEDPSLPTVAFPNSEEGTIINKKVFRVRTLGTLSGSVPWLIGSVAPDVRVRVGEVWQGQEVVHEGGR